MNFQDNSKLQDETVYIFVDNQYCWFVPDLWNVPLSGTRYSTDIKGSVGAGRLADGGTSVQNRNYM